MNNDQPIIVGLDIGTTKIAAIAGRKNEFGKRTTQDLFGKCLHKYVITDAIRDPVVVAEVKF